MLRDVCADSSGATPLTSHRAPSGSVSEETPSAELAEIERAFVDIEELEAEEEAVRLSEAGAGIAALDVGGAAAAAAADDEAVVSTPRALQAAQAQYAGLELPKSMEGGEGAVTASGGAAPPPLETGKKTASRVKITGMIRGLVSKEKRRFIEDGFNLDLTYITPRVIAMGFPSEGTEGVYRNPMSEVVSFLESRHKEHYMVYNLCSERSYDPGKFNNRVKLFPFDDHNPPPLRMIPQLCRSMQEFLAEDDENVAVLHCKAGKGRTGTMICSYLVYGGDFVSAEKALLWYGSVRTHDCKGVTIPSQRRYVQYVEKLMPALVTEKRLPIGVAYLKSLRFTSQPNFDGKGGCEPWIEVRQGGDVLMRQKHNGPLPPLYHPPKKEKEGSISGADAAAAAAGDDAPRQVGPGVWATGAKAKASGSSKLDQGIGPPSFDASHLEVSGDFKVVLYDGEPSKKRKMLSFWMNALCVCADDDEETVVLPKAEIDGASSDKHHKKFSADFVLEVTFASALPDEVRREREAAGGGSMGDVRLDDDDDGDDDDDDDEGGGGGGGGGGGRDGGGRSGSSGFFGQRIRKMGNPLRHLVSKKKRRFKAGGFDLDLAYITERIIAMGFPSEGTEGVYRNPMSEVVSFLDSRHADHYMVYNLCSERSYDPGKFHRRVQTFPFDDHNPPPLRMMREFCAHARTYLDEDPSNVVCIHCKAGKGRTGVMISAMLLHDAFFTEPDDALAFYGFARTNDCKGVTIPSQRAYVHYYAKLSREPALLPRVTDKSVVYSLIRVRLVTLPHEKSKDSARDKEYVLKVRQRSPEASWTTKSAMITDVRCARRRPRPAPVQPARRRGVRPLPRMTHQLSDISSLSGDADASSAV